MKRMTKKERERIDQILECLKREYGTEYTCYLTHKNAWQLLIATILSAQCTDARVNIVTKDLFVKYPDLESFAAADLKELEKDIHSTGFYHNKAKNIIACTKALVEEYQGEVPSDLESLTKLAGVGRKTANVVYAVAFGGQAIAVDTHVFCLFNRLGLVDASNVLDTEKQLMQVLPQDKWADSHHYSLLHGRYVCKSQNPNCKECSVKQFCKYFREHNNG